MKRENHLFKMQFFRLISRKEFKIACIFSFAYIAAAYLEVCGSVWGVDRSILYTAAAGWIGSASILGTQVMQIFYFFVIYLLAALPFADSYLEDRKSRALAPILARGNWNAYWRSGLTLTFLSGALVVLVPLLVAQLFSFLIFPLSDGRVQAYSGAGAWADIQSTLGYLFPTVAVRHPYLYNLIFMVYSAVFVGLNAAASYLLSLLGVHKKLLVLGGPTLFWLVYNAVAGVFSYALTPTVYLYPNDSVLKRPWFFFAAPAFLLLFLLISCFAVKTRRKEAVLL